MLFYRAFPPYRVNPQIPLKLSFFILGHDATTPKSLGAQRNSIRNAESGCGARDFKHVEAQQNSTSEVNNSPGFVDLFG